MTPVYQTDFSNGSGNCLQASLATLLDLPLESVPHFRVMDGWFATMFSWLRENGYEYHGAIRNPRNLGGWGEDKMKTLGEKSHGVNGYYLATVYSPNLSDFGLWKTRSGNVSTHAVVIDVDYNIVHDPNPAYKDLFDYPLEHWLDYHGVIEVWMIERRTDMEGGEAA